MEKIDPSKTSFTYQAMIPEAEEEITVLWGRKIVQNLINGYGLIGTIRLEGKEPYWIDLGLTKKFLFPPSVYAFYQKDSNGTMYFDGDSFYNGRLVHFFLSGDRIGFQINGHYLAPTWFGAWSYIDVYFKLHGV